MRRVLSTALFVELLLPFAVARADLPPPEEPPNPCAGRKAGDSCGASAVCKDSTCCKRRHVSATMQHYEQQKPLNEQDLAIINPPETCSPCLACEAASPPPAPVTATNPPAAATSEAAQSKGCAIAATDGAGLLGAVLLGLGLARRRRGRSDASVAASHGRR